MQIGNKELDSAFLSNNSIVLFQSLRYFHILINLNISSHIILFIHHLIFSRIRKSHILNSLFSDSDAQFLNLLRKMSRNQHLLNSVKIQFFPHQFHNFFQILLETHIQSPITLFKNHSLQIRNLKTLSILQMVKQSSRSSFFYIILIQTKNTHLNNIYQITH